MTDQRQPARRKLKYCRSTHVPCALCGSRDYMVICAVRGRHHEMFDTSGKEMVVKCTGCGHVYLNPRPAPEMLEAVWANHPISVADPVSPEMIVSAQGDMDCIQRFKKSGKLLEIGCGYGALLAEAKKRGFEVWGWEINPNKCEFIKKRFGIENISSKPLTELGFADGTFDVVAMMDVIEHIADVRGLLREVNRLLKPGGLLYMNTPDYHGIRSRATRSKWRYLYSFSHFHFFYYETLKKLLESEGFVIQARLLKRSSSRLSRVLKWLLQWINVYDELCVAALKTSSPQSEKTTPSS